jgi:hypothetical protein
MVTGRALLVARTCINVSDAGELVRTPVFKGTRACEVVGGAVFKASAVVRLVARAVGMGTAACVNVGPGAVMGARPDRMVSAASMAACDNQHGAYVSMHGGCIRAIAGTKSSVRRNGTAERDGCASAIA